MPLGRPLYEKTELTRLAGVERSIRRLRNRGPGRWVYPGGVPAADPGGIDGGGFTSPWADTGDGTSSTDGLTRYRYNAGGGLDIVPNFAGGADGDPVFDMLDNYWSPLNGKQSYALCDDSGAFTAITIVSNMDGTATVYAGRV